MVFVFSAGVPDRRGGGKLGVCIQVFTRNEAPADKLVILKRSGQLVYGAGDGGVFNRVWSVLWRNIMIECLQVFADTFLSKKCLTFGK